MSLPLDPKVLRGFQQLKPGAYEQQMKTGRRIDDTTVTLAGAPEGKCWVRTEDNSRELTAVWGDPSDINLDVIVDRTPTGDLYIKRLAFQDAVIRKGATAHAKLLPRTGAEVFTKVAGLGFLEGGVTISPTGGLNVRISPFWHHGASRRYEDDSDIDVSSLVPGTAGEVCWIVVYVDPSDDSADAVATTAVFGEPQDLEEVDIASATLPAGVIPCGAFTLKYGQTQVSASRFAERRLFLRAWDASGGSSAPSGSLERITATPLYESLAPTSGKYDLSNSAFDDYDRLELFLENAESTVNATADSGHIEFGTGGGSLDTTATNYYTQVIGGSNGAASNAEANNQVGFILSGASGSTPAGYATSVKITIFNPGDTSFHKRVLTEMVVARDSANMDVRFYSFFWRNTGAIDRIGLKIFNDPTSTFTSTTRLTIIGYKKEVIGGLALSDVNVSSPPTDAELDAEFGTPATVGNGFQALVDDGGADSAVYYVASNGTSWWYTALTKAT